jgi:hypothetical protein
MRKAMKHEPVPTMFFRNHWIEVPNVEVLKRAQSLMPLTLAKESKNFFEQILNIKKDHEPVFLTGRAAKGR